MTLNFASICTVARSNAASRNFEGGFSILFLNATPAISELMPTIPALLASMSASKSLQRQPRGS